MTGNSPTPSRDDTDAFSSDTSCELFEMANSPPTITSPGGVTDCCSPGTEEMKGAFIDDTWGINEYTDFFESIPPWLWDANELYKGMPCYCTVYDRSIILCTVYGGLCKCKESKLCDQKIPPHTYNLL